MLIFNTLFSVLPSTTEKIFVAYSGGVDSHVLLHLATSVPAIHNKLIAVYVHHGLQTEAGAWAVHCEKVAVELGVQFRCLQVNATKTHGQSQEEVARNVRYQALAELLSPQDVVLVAQHREDQMESLLLQLFRGAGLPGLAAMPVVAECGAGKLYRPLLDVSKQTLLDYAQQQGLQWIEDPSNQSNDFDRNFLRNQIVPQLKQRWAGLDKTVSRSARHCANAQQLLEGLAQELLVTLYNESRCTLNISGLLALDSLQRPLVIRAWFARAGLRMPTEKIVQRIISEVAMAQASANPKIQTKEYSIRRYREQLYLMANLADIECVAQNWSKESSVLHWEKWGSLSVQASDTGIAKRDWKQAEIVVRFRVGKEKIRLPDREGYHSLKNLFQERGIPPWERNQLPLIYLNGQLAAVADLWVSADFYHVEKGACYQLEWQKHPR